MQGQGLAPGVGTGGDAVVDGGAMSDGQQLGAHGAHRRETSSCGAASLDYTT